MTAGADLVGGELTLLGRIRTASNATFLGEIDGVRVVYKPVAGEQPLRDFPDATLARREVASYLVSEAFGWGIVPRTWLGDGPLGIGMLQLWQDVDPSVDAVAVFPVDDVPERGWRHVFDGDDEWDRPVALVHEDTAALRRMAVFDVVVNNADRKGGHVLALPGGIRHGCDHGLTFHSQHKLRTVLWGWVDEPLDAAELDGVDRVRWQLYGELGDVLADYLTSTELEALLRRCDRLHADARFPVPRGRMPAVPWPIF